MKFLLMALLGTVLSTTPWLTDFDQAKQTAQSDNKMILVNFSGSDWCGPCIRMHKDIFENQDFLKYAQDRLVLVNADFPRLKKNALSKDQQNKNDQLADTYNKEGTFPLTLLLSADGKILKKWEGLPKLSADEFTNEIKKLSDGK
jgi:thiol-disulfide isomerase/thioredoxin